jgi:hypothetical protein
MTGAEQMEGRYWPTSAQLVVVCGEPELVAQWFDAVRENHEAQRDVVDLLDEAADAHVDERWGERFDEAVERLRHTLWAVRQWMVDR